MKKDPSKKADKYDNLEKVVHLIKYYKPLPNKKQNRSAHNSIISARAEESKSFMTENVQKDLVNRKGGISHLKTSKIAYFGQNSTLMTRLDTVEVSCLDSDGS